MCALTYVAQSLMLLVKLPIVCALFVTNIEIYHYISFFEIVGNNV